MAYANIEIRRSQEELGITPATIARIVSATSPRGVKGSEELWQIADGCGVPRSFMEHGFGREPDEPGHDERLEALESEVSTIRSMLAEVRDLRRRP